jgi:hypothetical protein
MTGGNRSCEHGGSGEDGLLEKGQGGWQHFFRVGGWEGMLLLSQSGATLTADGSVRMRFMDRFKKQE